MSQLEPVTLVYDGKEYRVTSDDGIWGLIEVIENVITFLELARHIANKTYPSAKIFRAYAAALNYAGATVNHNEIRESSKYVDLGKMAGALAAILLMAQPGGDVDLGESTSSTEEAEEAKKKATADS